MKFWKQTLLTTLLFSVIVATLLYTSCEKDSCNNVTCLNGGACGGGVCKCPAGYEDAQCGTKSVARFVGTFAGNTTCNGGNAFIDTAFIYADTSKPQNVDYVYIVLNSIKPAVLHGYEQFNGSIYSIVVPPDTSANFFQLYTITLQGKNSLTIASYEQNESTPGDTVINKCLFIGTD